MAESLNNDGAIIYKADGTPFADEKAAKIQGSKLLSSQKIKTTVVEVEGGFALKRLYHRRPKRIPMGKRNVLTFPSIPGYATRVFNDDPNDMGQRIKAAQDAGWEIVYSDERLGDSMAGAASPVSKAVSKPVGGGKTGILMKKKQEYFDEDEAIKQQRVDRAEQGLVAAADVEGKYGKIKVGNKPY